MAGDPLRMKRMSAAHLRALAHPLRWQLLHVLRAEGPATASQLARRLGESSGATSYHLRALHRVGMVEEAEKRNARERWWQRSQETSMIPNSIPPDITGTERAELQAAHAQIESIIAERDEKALARWTEIRYDQSLEWQDSQFIGNFRIWATAAEVRDLLRSVVELTEPLRKPPESGDSERHEVHFTLRLLPQELDS